MTVAPSERFSQRFPNVVRVLLVLSVIWFGWAAWRYLSSGGWGLHASGFASLVLASACCGTLIALELARPLATPDPGRIKWRFTVVSAFAAVLCLGGLLLACTLVYRQSSSGSVLGTLITDDRQVNGFLSEHLPSGYVRVPTGVFVQSIEFKGTSNVAISGYLWQRVPDNLPAEPGVVLPEADEAYVASEHKVYERKQAGHTLLGWYFNAEFRQLFHYAAYPLDKQNVWLRLWPTTFNEPVVLVPDFAAYPPWHTAEMIGVDGQIVYGEWNPDLTGYSFVNNAYSSSFGYDEPAGISASTTPELYFNIGLKRDPQGPLFGQLIRWLFIALIVFAALFLITVDEQRREIVGFTTFEVISFAVGMLLVIVFDQNAVREATGAQGVVYLEYFSYALYAMILLVALNAMLITAKVRVPALVWGGNLLPKLLYWPGYFGLVLVATLLVFFR